MYSLHRNNARAKIAGNRELSSQLNSLLARYRRSVSRKKSTNEVLGSTGCATSSPLTAIEIFWAITFTARLPPFGPAPGQQDGHWRHHTKTKTTERSLNSTSKSCEKWGDYPLKRSRHLIGVCGGIVEFLQGVKITLFMQQTIRRQRII